MHAFDREKNAKTVGRGKKRKNDTHSIARTRARSSLPVVSFACRKLNILGDPGVDSGGKGKSKRAEKYGTKKSKERREEPLGTMSYQTSSKRSPPF